ncbi:MAG TPA: hypothetical protein VF551_07670 [Chthoniobacterales bacterium]
MKLHFQVLAVAVFLSSSSSHVAFSQANDARPSIVLRDVRYFHRWSQAEQHEFTPEKQDDLTRWTDMITVNGYPDARDGDALAAKANAVLETYKSHQGIVMKTSSVPRTPDRPAEHFVAVVFGRPAFIEAVFARIKMVDGAGCSIVYSHRIYGEKIGDQMSAWLGANGAAIEKALMDLSAFPSPKSLRGATPGSRAATEQPAPRRRAERGENTDRAARFAG